MEKRARRLSKGGAKGGIFCRLSTILTGFRKHGMYCDAPVRIRMHEKSTYWNLRRLPLAGEDFA